MGETCATWEGKKLWFYASSNRLPVRPGKCDSIASTPTDLSLVRNVETDSGPTSLLIQLVPESLSPGGKATNVESNYSPRIGSKLKMNGAILPLLHMLS
jgi:hypothetical protein